MRKVTFKLKQGCNLSLKAPISAFSEVEVIRPIVEAYFCSAYKRQFYKLPIELEYLLKTYLSKNNCKTYSELGPVTETAVLENFELNKGKAVCFLTGGKDSVHLLKTLVKRYSAENVLCLYVSNLNKSESFYETKFAPGIAKKYGCEYSTVRISNSIKINRTGHNIGLRDQLIVGLSLPYILKFNAYNIYFGVTRGDENNGPLYSESLEAHSYLEKYLSGCGVDLKIKHHPENIGEWEILKELCSSGEIQLCNSCYAQPNFRERHHNTIKAKMPGVPIYHGCGHCIKCVRINYALSIFSDPNNYDNVQFKNYLKEKLVKYRGDAVIIDLDRCTEK